MAVPEGIVERKDMKVICAPPWGTNYEMKTKKNTKQLSYFYDEHLDDKRGDNEVADKMEIPNNPHEFKADENLEGNHEINRNVSEHDEVDIKQDESQHQTDITVEDSEGSKFIKDTQLIESKGDHLRHNNPILGHTSSIASLTPRMQYEHNKFNSSKSVQDVKPKTKAQYETSNSAYGLYQPPGESECGLPKSYRRVSSFSKLYGDKQPLKK